MVSHFPAAPVLLYGDGGLSIKIQETVKRYFRNYGRETMYIVVYRLTNLLNNSQYNSTNMHICRKLLEIVADLERMSIAQVADKCNVSKSTLSKFVKTLGFENYKDFRENAIREKDESFYTGNVGLEMEKYIEK